jgi:hypothetical protein
MKRYSTHKVDCLCARRSVYKHCALSSEHLAGFFADCGSVKPRKWRIRKSSLENNQPVGLFTHCPNASFRLDVHTSRTPWHVFKG